MKQTNVHTKNMLIYKFHVNTPGKIPKEENYYYYYYYYIFFFKKGSCTSLQNDILTKTTIKSSTKQASIFICRALWSSKSIFLNERGQLDSPST